MKKILLADDSITIQKVVELTFSEGDYQVVCVSNGAQALRKIPEMLPDIVLLDVIMPEKNGYEVCEELRRNPATSGIPVLLLTGTFEPFDKKRAEAAGASGHLTKPFESQTLVSKVEEMIAARLPVGPRGRAGDLDRDAPLIESPAPTPPAEPAAASAASTGPATGFEPWTSLPVPPLPPLPEGPAEPAPHLTSPAPADPATGGSYLGFADLRVGMEEPELVPDRYDNDRFSPSTTVRMSGDPGPTPAESPAPRGNGSLDLTPEAVDRIAEEVVRRMSDRVVREIAWEVIPQVAETLVRRRIKELEEGGGS